MASGGDSGRSGEHEHNHEGEARPTDHAAPWRPMFHESSLSN